MSFPTATGSGESDFVIERSAFFGVTVTLAVLSAATGSKTSLAVIVAVLVLAPFVTTNAVMCRVFAANTFTVPTVQIPVTLEYAPAPSSET